MGHMRVTHRLHFRIQHFSSPNLPVSDPVTTCHPSDTENECNFPLTYVSHYPCVRRHKVVRHINFYEILEKIFKKIWRSSRNNWKIFEMISENFEKYFWKFREVLPKFLRIILKNVKKNFRKF